MAKGKFEAGSKSRVSDCDTSDLYAVRDKPANAPQKRRIWPMIAALVGAAVLLVGVIVIAQGWSSGGSNVTDTDLSDSDIQGMSRTELEQRANNIGIFLNRDLVLILVPQVEEGAQLTEKEQSEASAQITVSKQETGVGFDFTKLYADLDAGVGKKNETTYCLDLRNYLTLDEAKLRAVAERVEKDFCSEREDPVITLEELADGENGERDGSDESGEDETGEDDETPDSAPDRQLVIRLGSAGRNISADEVFDALKSAYETIVVGEEPEQALRPTLTYRTETPEQLVDIEALWKQYCKEPVEPTIDRQTGEVLEGQTGYGFDKEELRQKLEKAQYGSEIKVLLTTIQPTIDTQTFQERLFKDLLAEAHTPHTNIWNRTTNLTLACQAVDGTIVMPGEVFSFNEVVGQRTEEKGYKEAIAYVRGESTPELGGGICQVASSIYYSVLMADLKTVERAPHMYLVDYVPSGMDATIYWGSYDFKFENTSPYPIKIDASVSDGKVHVMLRGTEWKDYTVKVFYEVQETDPWKEVKKDVPRDGEYYEGEVITTPYTGYKIATYKTTYDLDGKELETTEIAISRYKRRDKVVAHLIDSKTTQPTQPKPTDPPPTDPPPTDPPPTDPPPTDPPPTDPPPTDPPPTDPPPTDPPPTDPLPTNPPPTDPPPTDPPPTDPPPTESDSEGG